MSNIPLSRLSKIQSMQDSDSIVVIVSGKEYLITKENFSKVISTLTTTQKNKLSTILLSGDGSKVLTDSGVYKSISEILGGKELDSYILPVATENTLGGVKVDGITITISEDGIISGLSDYKLPTATNTVLGGVKVDGNTIKINDGVISADVVGEKGEKGDKGDNGIDGKSAYEIAVDNGFVGTEEEFLQSLYGKDGVTTITTTKIDKTCTFASDGWSDTTPYTQTVEVESITEDLNPRIDVIISDDIDIGKKEEAEFSYFTKVITGNGTLTAYCYEIKPTVDLNVMIEVI